MKEKILGKLAFLVFAAILPPSQTFAREVTVLAAASLTDALKEIAATYEKESGDKVMFNFGASSTLARQIREGAPADLFLSADEAKMDGLEKAGLLAPGTRRSILSNRLAVVVLAGSPLPISQVADLAGSRVRAIALAEPQTVPAGIYAKEYLLKTGLWPTIRDRVVPTENVRAALAAVESGNVDAGIVYRTDALISKRVRVAFEVPSREGPDISHPFAMLKESASPEAARRLLAYLASKAARDVFVKYGFLLKE